ncbi:hypothetical protein [Streptomyces yaizuensis]|uniref:Uncharacterized protein n=1 Tax=Streptomyces yaizuensis TaxID=2989713 RepID=A0ABQ5P623_9ACTN|nr:hypothetical protein [Streptomyces sp. YSPA8]GLF98020.1 hypothetical protein SYYSPA8_27005 [Streptomyces sp. YSPA8]
MTPIPAPAIWRFADHDTVRDGGGRLWYRGLRHTRRWAVPGDDAPAGGDLDDEAVRGLLAADPRAVFAPAWLDAYTPLPGRELTGPGALRLLDIRPATGATLHRCALGRTGAFLGSATGSPRPPAQGLRPADVRASLQGTAERHRAARITLDRVHGRIHARYAIAHTLHTHTYVLTTS